MDTAFPQVFSEDQKALDALFNQLGLTKPRYPKKNRYYITTVTRPQAVELGAVEVSNYEGHELMRYLGITGE